MKDPGGIGVNVMKRKIEKKIRKASYPFPDDTHARATLWATGENQQLRIWLHFI